MSRLIIEFWKDSVRHIEYDWSHVPKRGDTVDLLYVYGVVYKITWKSSTQLHIDLE